MRKIFTILFIAITAHSFGQNRLYNLTTPFDSVKMRKLLLTVTTQGNPATDSILVKKPNGGVYRVAPISVGGGGTVTSFSKTDNYGIVSSITNPTSTPNHAIGVDTTNGTGIMTKPNYYPMGDVRYIKVLGETRAIQTSNNITSSSGALVGNQVLSTANNVSKSVQTRSMSSTAIGLNLATGGATHSTGSYKAVAITPTISESSTAGYQALFISPFESLTGSGAKLLIDVGTNTAASGGGTHTSKFTVDNAGNITATSLNSAITATTQAAGDNSTKIATTAYVDRIHKGSISLTAGVGSATVTGLSTSSMGTTGFVSIGGTVTTTWQYKIVCTANTVTITAITNTGTTNTTDTSTIQYIAIN